MGIEITKQINNNECGVCVINTLLKHFYNQDIKNKLLDEANITEKGLNIIDFENLCDKYGIGCESFQVSNDELANLNEKKIMVTLINKNGMLHYTIIKKHKNFIELFDSMDGNYKMLIDDFNNIFSGILIFIKKNKNNKIIKFNHKKISFFINIKWLLLSLLLQSILIITSILEANFFSLILENGLSINDYRNIIILLFIYVIVLINTSVFNVIFSLLSNKVIKKDYICMLSDIMEKLKHKNHSFFNKINEQNMILFEYIIKYISVFNNQKIINLIVGLLSSLIVFFLLILTNIYFIIFCLLTIVCILIIKIINFIHVKNNLKKIYKNDNIGNILSIDLFRNMKKNNLGIENKINDIKSNYFEYINLNNELSNFNNLLNVFLNICKKIINILIACFSYFIIQYKKGDISSLIYVMMVFEIYFNSINEVGDFFIAYSEYQYVYEIYVNLQIIGSRTNNSDLKLENIENIEIKQHQINKNSIINDININEILNNSEIKINGINILEYKSNTINESIMVINQYDEQNINNQVFTYKKVIDFINKYKINLFNSKIQTYQLINILNCILCENKIIFFNDCFRYINKKYMNYLKKYILPYISKRNYVIYIKNLV